MSVGDCSFRPRRFAALVVAGVLWLLQAIEAQPRPRHFALSKSATERPRGLELFRLLSEPSIVVDRDLDGSFDV